jgi:hypothetical protein
MVLIPIFYPLLRHLAAEGYLHSICAQVLHGAMPDLLKLAFNSHCHCPSIVQNAKLLIYKQQEVLTEFDYHSIIRTPEYMLICI